ncbi:MAG: GNAT family N-acetyltransferase [Hyphomicrobium sp.]|nr:GNAT family N-acetyltransferase [Hyphomicrobium sp.]
MTRLGLPLRPYLPTDAMALRELFAQSIYELTAEEYDEDQRVAWAATAEDADAFAARLAALTTIVIEVDGEHLGFAALKGSNHFEDLFVHPWYAGEGVGTALADAVEALAKGRGATEITVEASETAEPFFKARGYKATERRSVERFGEWLTHWAMKKSLGETAEGKRP